MASTVCGTWHNQLGSRMELAVDSNGSLTGSYHSKVGSVPKVFKLAGRCDTAPPPPPGVGMSLGWAVTFFNEDPIVHSTATWSGQFFEHSNTINTH